MKCINNFFCQFLDQCVNELVETGEVPLENYSEDSIQKEALVETKNYVQKFLRTAVIKKECKPDPSLSDEVNQALRTCYNVRHSEIFQVLAKESVLKKGYKLVENFDWKLRWILGSSDLATIREPVLKVDFNCVHLENNDKKTEIVHFEATLDKVDELIQALEDVKKELDSS